MWNNLLYSISLITVDICLIIITLLYFYIKRPIKYSKVSDRDYDDLIQNYKIIKQIRKSQRQINLKLFIVKIIPLKTIKNILKKTSHHDKIKYKRMLH